MLLFTEKRTRWRGRGARGGCAEASQDSKFFSSKRSRTRLRSVGLTVLFEAREIVSPVTEAWRAKRIVGADRLPFGT